MQGHEMTVRSRLKLLIAERNIDRIRQGLPELTLRQIAEAARLPSSTVSGLTSGRAGRVDFRTLDRLCRYFDVQPGELLEYVPEASDAAPRSSGRDDSA